MRGHPKGRCHLARVRWDATILNLREITDQEEICQHLRCPGPSAVASRTLVQWWSKTWELPVKRRFWVVVSFWLHLMLTARSRIGSGCKQICSPILINLDCQVRGGRWPRSAPVSVTRGAWHTEHLKFRSGFGGGCRGHGCEYVALKQLYKRWMGAVNWRFWFDFARILEWLPLKHNPVIIY